MILQEWLNSNTCIQDHSECLCDIPPNDCLMDGELVCNWGWEDGSEESWLVNVLEDGTAVTWCVNW